MVSAVENIAVLFCKYNCCFTYFNIEHCLDNSKSSKMDQILESMETIDDDCDTRGVHFVKIADPAAAYHYGISTLPTLVYFKNSVPNLFDGKIYSIICTLTQCFHLLCTLTLVLLMQGRSANPS